MKKLLKLMIFVGLVAAAIVVVTTASRKRATEPRYIKPTPWTPPVVDETPPAAVEEEPGTTEEAIAAAEAEGMTPPVEVPAEDFAVNAGGETVISELASPAATADVLEEDSAESFLEEELHVADEEGMALPPDEPVEDIAVSATGETLVSELASPTATAEVLEEPADEEPTEKALDVAETEGMTPPPDAPAEDVALNAEGEPIVSELASPAAAEAVAESSSIESAPDFGAMLEAVEAAGRAAETPEPEEEEQPSEPETTSREQDFLTQYFDKLAATPEDEPVAEEAPSAPEAPEEAETPATPVAEQAPPASTIATPSDENLLASVEEALGDLEPAPIVPPPRRTAESYLDEGNVYFNVGQYGLAIERYGQAIEMDRDLTAAYYNRANAHTRAGEFDKALGDYDRALELQPVDADALNNRGMLHLYRANYSAALSDFNKALDIDPSDTTVMVNRGLAQLHGGNAAAALVDFREAAAMDSGDAAAQYGAAQAAASMNNRDEALRYVARALEIDPGYAREAAADPRLAMLAGDDEFMKLLRQSGSRSS